MYDSLTLDHLRVLIAIADSGSFSAAARRLQRVQSAISQSVRALESSLEVVLFDRSGRFPVLTPQGVALVADVKQLLREADTLKAKARAMSAGLEPELALAVDPLFPNRVLMDALHDVQKQFPTLPIRLITAGLGVPERYLREGAVSLALYSLETTGAADLSAQFMIEIEMIPVVAPSHPLAALAGCVGRDDLESHIQLVLSDAGGGSWSRGMVSSKVWRFADQHVRLEFLLAGFGWCNMPVHLVADDLEAGRLVALNLREQPGFSLSVHVVQKRDHALGMGASALVAALKCHLHHLSRASVPGQAWSIALGPDQRGASR
ncbi:MAG: LysR family transcriptional regulator [Alphaproteobacteria bacterium]|nr:LysR family transcriptional regulator [Alphaproteobacteria bacterium]MBU1551535.1 LysR family transcriptional regulator [Alphaproteobacteria bacterium]MBU2337270.1 LysR family transcriptional regulator [Alphaproteobacteria bacterium]MBU2388013.1 LysR family transcriptional regulator [Alphaproteobacteria bacterium]